MKCKYLAAIVENRFDVTEIIAAHQKFLPDYFEVRHINDPNIHTEADYNRLLTTRKFWEDLPYERVLIFQHDSRLLRHGIEEFLEWDFCGSPWRFQQWGGNGGLSIRNPEAMIEVIDTIPYRPQLGQEDVFFSNVLKELKHRKLAPRSVCSKFACETIFKMQTLGCHAIERYLTPQECKLILNQYTNE